MCSDVNVDSVWLFFPHTLFKILWSAVSSFLSTGGGEKKIEMGGYNVRSSLLHHWRCWIYKIMLQNCTKKFWEEWDPRKHLLSLYILSWRLPARLWCARKCLRSATTVTMLSYSPWGKRGIFTPRAQWLGCICWIEYWKKEVSKLLSNCKPTVCSCGPKSRCKTKSK